MTIKERIEILDVTNDINNQRITEIEAKMAELQVELDTCRNRAHEYEIERRTLVTLNNIYKDKFPGDEVNIILTPKTVKTTAKSKASSKYDGCVETILKLVDGPKEEKVCRFYK